MPRLARAGRGKFSMNRRGKSDDEEDAMLPAVPDASGHGCTGGHRNRGNRGSARAKRDRMELRRIDRWHHDSAERCLLHRHVGQHGVRHRCAAADPRLQPGGVADSRRRLRDRPVRRRRHRRDAGRGGQPHLQPGAVSQPPLVGRFADHGVGLRLLLDPAGLAGDCGPGRRAQGHGLYPGHGELAAGRHERHHRPARAERYAACGDDQQRVFAVLL